jgi:glycosyltransferase involved in cell wall biosynthesis
VREDETGYLVPAADSARLAEQMLYALTHETESAARAARGRVFVREQFSMQRMVAATERLYNELGNCPQ